MPSIESIMSLLHPFTTIDYNPQSFDKQGHLGCPEEYVEDLYLKLYLKTIPYPTTSGFK